MIRVGEEIRGVNLRDLTEIRSSRFLKKLFILVSLVAGLWTAVLLTKGVFLFLSVVLLGLVYAHAVELQHQCLHYTGFRSKAWNRCVGVALGLPSLVSFSDYQASHFQHHKLLGTPEDREFFNYGYDALTSLRALIPHVFMVRHYWDVTVYIIRSITSVTRTDVSKVTAKRIRNEYRIIAGFLLFMIAVAIVFGVRVLLEIWLLPLMIAIPTHALVELPEHIGCENQTTDVLRNTRTIKASKFAVWFTDGNNYHVEHHWLPSVPNDRLADLHLKVESKIVHLEKSYWSFYWWFLQQIYHRNLRVHKYKTKGA